MLKSPLTAFVSLPAAPKIPFLLTNSLNVSSFFNLALLLVNILSTSLIKATTCPLSASIGFKFPKGSFA